MKSERPPIERRTPINQVVVDRTGRSGNRLIPIVLALAVGAGLVYFAAVRRPELVDRFGIELDFDSLVTRISGALTDAPMPTTAAPGSLENLHAAIISDDLPGVDAMVNQLPSAELNRPLNGMTSLMMAASIGNAEVLRALLAHGADPNARGAHQRTALQYAAEKNRLRAARLLLDAGADIDGADSGSLTPLIMAADRDYTQFALLLMERGANVNIQNVEGWTALMDAAEAGNIRLVSALLAAGARSEARHRDGSTALDFARRGNHQEVVRILSPNRAAIPPTTASPSLARPGDMNGPALPAKKGERQ